MCPSFVNRGQLKRCKVIVIVLLRAGNRFNSSRRKQPRMKPIDRVTETAEKISSMEIRG
ncbi:MAG: hypothetical protein METHSR3v1_1020008, partial [Methanothrix sp.]